MGGYLASKGSLQRELRSYVEVELAKSSKASRPLLISPFLSCAFSSLSCLDSPLAAY